ncbi:hypothetical protein NXX38_17010 [Bacteroides sp. BFG-637]|nr:hypothetical protein [Bacteroides sp. BFG-637]MCS3313500.1 hypothetical protein [Bacteroides sp. BFG-637]
MALKKIRQLLVVSLLPAGLAFLALLFLSIICDYFWCVKSTRFLVMSGQNPMIAYEVGDLLIMPLATYLCVASIVILFST